MTNEPRPQVAKTPFDSPWFLPGLYLVLALWFGYDGWLNEKTEAVLFNRALFAVWVVLGLFRRSAPSARPAPPAGRAGWGGPRAVAQAPSLRASAS